MRTAVKVHPTPDELNRLHAIVAGDSRDWLVQRARGILMAADGLQNKQIAAELMVLEHTVARWRRRFAADGIAGIESDAPRSGRPPEVTNRIQDEVMRLTKTFGCWSMRRIAREVRASLDTVRRILRKHGAEATLVVSAEALPEAGDRALAN